MQELNWNDLKYVLAVSRARSLAGAARRIGVNETTVARRIARVERHLETRLFERTLGTLQATDAGVTAVDSAERIEREIQQTETAIAGVDGLAAGVVRLTAVPVIVNRVLVPALPDLLQEHPALQVELIAEPRDLSLTRRDADIAVRMARPAKDQRAVTRRIGEIEYGVYAHAQCDKDDLPWITYEDGMAHLPQAEWMTRQTVTAPATNRPPIRVNDAEAVLHAAKRGLGKSLVPIPIASREHDLVRIDSGPPPLVRELWLMVHPELRELRRIRVVMDWLAATASRL